jgi:hypothetical protein
MIAITLALALAQAPTQGCITVNGARICGFGCIDNGSQGACAKTPLGVCAKNSGSVTCFDPPTWLAAVWSTPPRPSCVTDGTSIACGYDCKRQSGQAQCAQTPKGVCTTTSNQLQCFDPPPEVYGALGANVPSPSCVVREGKIACGYSCVTGNGVTACAKTPFGVCAEDGGNPTCFDPPKAVVCATAGSVPAPKCQPMGAGRLACGYNCATASGVTACSQTPDGKCDTGGPGQPQCFDPPARGGSATCLEAASASSSR